MRNKNIKLCSENRLVYFSEVPRLAESDVQNVRKEKEGPELDTKGLVAHANAEIDKYTAQLKEMPDDFNKLLHDEIVKYLQSSASRYEKNEIAGLSGKEFGEYRNDMIAKTKELLAEYAPTEEDLKKKKEADKQAKETQKNAENVEKLDVKAVQEDPGAIHELQTLSDKFDEYNGWNSSLQKAGADVLTLTESIGKSYGEYKKNRDGVGAYKKFKGYLFPENDQQRIDMQKAVSSAKQKVAEALSKFAETKTKLKKYGEGLRKASDAQKQAQVAEKAKAINQIDSHTKDSEEVKKAREEQYNKLSANQKSLEGEKKSIENYRENLLKGKEAVEIKERFAQNKRENLTQFDSSVKAAISRVDDALKNNKLSKDEIAQLQETKLQLVKKSLEVGVGLKATGEVLSGTSKSTTILTDKEKILADRSSNIRSHLEGQVIPTLDALEGSIKTLEGAKMKFATTRAEVDERFDKIFKTYDSVDGAVDNAVLKNNMANEQINSQLSKMDKSLANMDVNPPIGWIGAAEATVGVPLSMIGGGLSEAGHFCLDQATWLSNTLASSKDDWTKTTLGSVGYWTARVGVEVISSTIGVTGGLLELGSGIFTMAAHPVDTVKGLGTLVGLNPDVPASVAWAEMGKAIISWEDFKAGRIGVGIGKVFVNVVTTVTGAGALGAAGKAGEGAYIAARIAGKGVTRSLAKAGVEGGIAAGKFVGKEIGEGIGNVGKKIKSVKTLVTGAEAAEGVAAKVVSGVGEAENLLKNPQLVLQKFPEIAENRQIHKNLAALDEIFQKPVTFEQISKAEELIETLENSVGRIEHNNAAIKKLAAQISGDQTLPENVRTKLVQLVENGLAKTSDVDGDLGRLKNYHLNKLPELISIDSAKYLDELSEYNPEKVKNLRSLDFKSNFHHMELLRGNIADEIVQYRSINKKLKLLKSDFTGLKINIEDLRKFFSKPEDQKILTFLDGGLDEKGYIRTLDSASFEAIKKLGNGYNFGTFEKVKIYAQIEGKIQTLRSSNLPKKVMEAELKKLEECRKMLKEGVFSPDIAHGTSSLVWDGLASSGGEMLSGAELKRRGIISRTGEKDLAGGLAEQDAIFCGTGADGLGTARAYGELNKYAEGYRSPIYYDIPTIKSNIEFYKSTIAKMDALNATEVVVGLSGANRKTFARVLAEWEEALEIKTNAPHLIKDEPYQLIFGLKNEGLSTMRLTRKTGEALSGEIKVLESKISLAEKLEVVYVPAENIANARAQLIKILGEAKGAQVKIYSIESLDMIGGMRGEGNLYNKAFDSTYQHLSGHTKSVKDISAIMMK